MKANTTMKKSDLMTATGMSPRAAGPMKGMTMDQMYSAKKGGKGGRKPPKGC